MSMAFRWQAKYFRVQIYRSSPAVIEARSCALSARATFTVIYRREKDSLR